MELQKTTLIRFQSCMVCAVALSFDQAITFAAAAADSTGTGLVKTSVAWSQIGAKAGAEYHGEGLAVVPTAEGARLRCVFQRLEAEATPEGLWMTSALTNAANDHFRVLAARVGRHATAPVNGSGDGTRSDVSLPQTGTVAIAGQIVRFARPGLVEEYSVGLEGVRQDFVVSARPAGSGELAVRLAVSGAKVESVTQGAQLVLNGSCRKIAYNRLRVTDATGKELQARIEVCDRSETGLSVMVDDAEAVYPVRIDPTFSDANWISMNPSIPGADAQVTAAAVDGSGNVYIGGRFTVVGGVIANGIAKWDGTNWSALGSGMNGSVSALAVSAGNLYAGGVFTTAGGVPATNIAKWDGSTWSALGSGMDGGVSALAVSGTNLYAGGGFTAAGGSAANYIARWDGSAWSALGSGMNASVSALAVSASDLYAGGSFGTAGGQAASGIAKWDGSTWSALGSGVGVVCFSYTPICFGSATVSALAVSGTNLYAGGGFLTAGGTAANYIAKWDGRNWSALGSGMGDGVSALTVSGIELYATANGSIAKWDGSVWSELGSGMAGVVSALAVSGTHLYAGGSFTMAGATSANYIAKWDGSNWSALGSGMNGGLDGVVALAGSSTNLYAAVEVERGGVFYVAKWNGGSWSTLGSGMNGLVSALAVSGTNLYAGGSFTAAGGMPAANIAKWDGSSWSALGSGMSGGVDVLGGLKAGVSALVVLGSDLYVGGNFTAAGGVSATNIAKWDGSGWSALGAGVGSGTTGDRVFTLAVSGGNLYAGGWFDSAGAVSATNIAKWDGNSWGAVGSGLNAGVGALALSGSDLYASVSSYLGGPPRFLSPDYIARWNGSSWIRAAGLVLSNNGPVSALAVSGSDLYVAGLFTSVGGKSANYIAKWNATNWSALGSGLNGGFPAHCNVSALVVSGNDLFAGGSFTIAGGKVSGYIARAYLPSLPALSVVRSGAALMVSWPSVDSAGFVLEQADTLVPPISWISNTASITDVGVNKSASFLATNNQRFFRLRGP